MHLAQTQQGYYVLRETDWEPGQNGPGAGRIRYIAYVGKEPKLTRSKAERICEEKGIAFDDLASVNGLEIIDDDPDPPP